MCYRLYIKILLVVLKVDTWVKYITPRTLMERHLATVLIKYTIY